MKYTSKTLALLLVAVLFSTAACGDSGDSVEPPDIQYGRDICVQCGMIISEERFAAAYTLADGTEKIFDDVGGLVLGQRASGDTVDPDRAWVHDFETSEWVVVGDAYFVPTSSVSSPMGHNILAFSDSDRATAFATDVGGSVIDWDTVVELEEHMGLIGHHHEMGSDEGEHDHMGGDEMGSDEMDMNTSTDHTDHE